MSADPPLAERIGQLLRDMGGVAFLPDDDPRRAAWIARKHNVLAEVQAREEAVAEPLRSRSQLRRLERSDPAVADD